MKGSFFASSRSNFSVMEFSITKTVKGRRLGLLKVKEPNKDVVLPTPACFLYTAGCCVPHLTHDILSQSVYQDNMNQSKPVVPMIFTLGDVRLRRATLEASGDGVVGYNGSRSSFDTLSVLLQNDPAVAHPPGHNTIKSVAAWTFAGKADVMPDEAVALARAAGCDASQVIADADVAFHDEETTRKRLEKAKKRSLGFADRIAALTNRDGASGERWWGTVLVGLGETGTCTYLKNLLEKIPSLSGFVFDGWRPPIDVRVAETTDDVNNAVTALSLVVPHLPEGLPRLAPRPATPGFIVDAVDAGIDLFDSSFPIVVAERGGALVFDCELEALEANFQEVGSSSEKTSGNKYIEVDLKAPAFAADFSALLENCECYTCRSHTRAYVHHLLDASELLGTVLLAAHNLYHYTKFFARVRTAIETDQWDSYREKISSYEHEPPSDLKKREEATEEPRKTKSLRMSE